MNRPLDDDGGYSERRSDPNRADREISLGTPTILGIFLALALVCACFFGFGYTMGRKSAQAASAATLSNDTAVVSGTSAPKPAAGSASAQTVIATPLPVADTSTPTAQTAVLPLNPPASSNSTLTQADRMIVGDKPPATPQSTTSNPQSATSFVVQVAAVSSQDVADILIGSLQKKGYTVAVRHEPQDKLLHVQIGPFADRKEAQAMQARVLADGFNAIVK